MGLCHLTGLQLKPRTSSQSGCDRTGGVWSEGLTCRPRGSTPELGPGPQAAGATWAAAHCGGRAAAAPSRSGRAGAGPQGAGPAAGPRRGDGQDAQGQGSAHAGLCPPKNSVSGRMGPFPTPHLQLTLCKKPARLSPKRAERKLTVALVCVQASCKLGCTTASRWEPQAGNVPCSQL